MPQGTKKITKSEVREKFIGEHYPMHFVARNIEITDAMKNYALEKIAKLDHFGGRVIDAWIVMDYQKGVNMVDFLVHINDVTLLCSGRNHDMYASIDEASDHLKSKLSRYHKMLHDIDQRRLGWVVHPGEIAITPDQDVNDLIEEETLKKIEEELRPHPVSARKKLAVKMLNEMEAITKMEKENELTCLLYKSEEDQKLKMIYRQFDGSYGIIEPEGL